MKSTFHRNGLGVRDPANLVEFDLYYPVPARSCQGRGQQEGGAERVEAGVEDRRQGQNLPRVRQGLPSMFRRQALLFHLPLLYSCFFCKP